MSNQSNSDLIARRTAFYDNTLYNLQILSGNIQDEKASKWCNNEDISVFNSVLSNLLHAEILISRRFGDVLDERADDLRSRLEAGNE